MGPRLEQLNAFLQVAETGSFTRAAERAGLSQSALSRSIRALETAAGAALFHRDTRHVELTDAGRLFRPQAARLLAELDAAFADLADLVTGRRGSLTIAALPSVASMILPAALLRFRRDWPEVEVRIHDRLAQPILQSVAEGEADLGLTIRPAQSARLSYREILTDEFCLLCRPDDPLAGDGPVRWSAFAERDFVAMSPETSVRSMTDAAFLQAGIAPRPLFGCGQLATAVGLVEAGLGITALPRLTLPLVARAGLHVRPLRGPALHRSIGAVVRQGRPLSAAAGAFFGCLARGSPPGPR